MRKSTLQFMKKKRVFINVIFVLTLGFVFLAHSYDQSQKESTKKYVGSKNCRTCHEEHYRGWKTTLHSKMEQEPTKEGPNKNILGDFSSKEFHLPFALEDVDMLVGSRFKQRYAKKIGDDYYMLPAQWNIDTKEWITYQPKNDWWAREGVYPKEWNKRPTSKLCEGCHTTDFNTKTKKPAERNITCESCHGAGSLHIEEEGKGHIINPANLNHERSNMICFQCHMSGRPPKGEFGNYAWPVGYRPGEDLKQYWIYAKPTGENAYEMWADGYAHKNRVQGNTFIQSKMYRKGLRCFTCHDTHGSRYTSFTVKSSENNSLCLPCHGDNALYAVFKASISEHTHHEANSLGSRCIECHMPKTGKNAVKWDARDHSFTFISPLATIRSGIPNGCNNCHKDKSPEWALKVVTEWQFE